MTGTRWGTSHFESRAAAVKYYRPYHYADTEKAVDRKLAEGEISIGAPEAKPGQTVGLDPDGRYWIEEADRSKTGSNPDCCGSGPHAAGEVRVMPTGGGGNLILCLRCWMRENTYRIARNRELGEFAKFEILEWQNAEVYRGDDGSAAAAGEATEATEADVFRPYDRAKFNPGTGGVEPTGGYAYKRRDGTLWNLDRIEQDHAHLWTVNAWGATHWEHVTEAQFRRDWRRC